MARKCQARNKPKIKTVPNVLIIYNIIKVLRVVNLTFGLLSIRVDSWEARQSRILLSLLLLSSCLLIVISNINFSCIICSEFEVYTVHYNNKCTTHCVAQRRLSNNSLVIACIIRRITIL